MIPTTKACIKPELETNLCGCFSDCGACWYTMCCYECAAATAWAEARGEPCTCCHLCQFPVMTRANIRHARGLELDFCSDLCSFTFCTFCFTIQNIRELKLIKTQSQIPDDAPTTVVVNQPQNPQNNNYPQNPYSGPGNYPAQEVYPPAGAYPPPGAYPPAGSYPPMDPYQIPVQPYQVPPQQYQMPPPPTAEDKEDSN